MNRQETIHASAVTLDGRGVLIRGVAGSGKSSLVLQLVGSARGARLVADDSVTLTAADGRLTARAPTAIAGLLEVRGQGILRLPYAADATLDLVVDLAAADALPRLPEPGERQVQLLGIVLPRIYVASQSGDAGVRVRAALTWPLCENV
jgi:serine kinase of HPr protein (carbohydrate metabolism regulator)